MPIEGERIKKKVIRRRQGSEPVDVNADIAEEALFTTKTEDNISVWTPRSLVDPSRERPRRRNSSLPTAADIIGREPSAEYELVGDGTTKRGRMGSRN